MKIGLFDIDSKIGNLALMKLSTYHKRLGDEVEFYDPFFYKEYDRVYVSKIFFYEHPNDKYIKNWMIKGGTGLDIYAKLPYNVEHIYPDYDLYGIDYAMGFITRGCIRNCSFCVVPKKEGMVRKNADYTEFTKEQENVMLMDNNILAYKNHLEELEKLKWENTHKHFDFNQGLDIRLINNENARALREIKIWKGKYRFSMDHPNMEKIFEKKIKILNDAGISNGILRVFLLVGYDTTPEEDMKRIQFLKERKIKAFVMPFNKFDKYQSRLARWVNRFYYGYISFEEFCDNFTKADLKFVNDMEL